MGKILDKLRIYFCGETDKDIENYWNEKGEKEDQDFKKFWDTIGSSDAREREKSDYRNTRQWIIDFLKEHADEIAARREEERKQIEAEDAKYPYPIKKSQVEEIADKGDRLKSDFCKTTGRKGITYLSFEDGETSLIEKEGKKYWQYQVTKGDISWIEFSKHGNTFCDGILVDNDFKLLRCLIDVETGEYSYFPEK